MLDPWGIFLALNRSTDMEVQICPDEAGVALADVQIGDPPLHLLVHHDKLEVWAYDGAALECCATLDVGRLLRAMLEIWGQESGDLATTTEAQVIDEIAAEMR